MTTPISAFLPWVLPQVPGCPDILAIKALRDTAVDFTQRTDLIQRILVSDCISGTQDYTITPAADNDVQRIISVSFQDSLLQIVPVEQVTSAVAMRGVAIGAATPQTGTPAYVFQKLPTDNGFALYPIPNITVVGGLTVRVSFQVTPSATTVDDELFLQWTDEIAAGALALLMMMPNQSFTNRETGKLYGAQYRESIARGQRKKSEGAMTGSCRVTPNRFC